MNNFAETVIAVVRDLNNRFWTMKAEVDRRVVEIQNKKAGGSTTAPTTSTSNWLNITTQADKYLLYF